MSTEQQMRAAMQEYIDAFNRRDAEAVIALYADDASVEDPVGTEPKVGVEAIAEFYRYSVGLGAELSLVAPIRTSHANSAAMAFDVQVTLEQGPCLIRVIDVMTFNEAGKFTSMRAYWGPGDMAFQPAD